MNPKLTNFETVAKKFVINLLLEGEDQNQSFHKEITDDDFNLPEWYDKLKFERGQIYFKNNNAGIMLSNVYGLLAMMSEPAGAEMLHHTRNSSDQTTARRRYISTIKSMLSWYENELKAGSRLWESLKKVRNVHAIASRSFVKNNIADISQFLMTLTTFGFMGFAISRPHVLGIAHDNNEDREAFIHFWAVIGSMLGVKDEFNMCLHPLPVVEIICRIFIRYAFMPFVQMETPTVKKLIESFVAGMKGVIPFSSHGAHRFLLKRLIGVPGYQYRLHIYKEILIRQIFDENELKEIKYRFQHKRGHEYRRNMVFDEKMHFLEIVKIEDAKEIGTKKHKNEKADLNKKYLMEILDLKHPDELKISLVEDENFKSQLNDHKFYELSLADRIRVMGGVMLTSLAGNSVRKIVVNFVLKISIFLIKISSRIFK